MGRGRRKGTAQDLVDRTIGGRTPEEWLQTDAINEEKKFPGFCAEKRALELLAERGVSEKDLEEFLPKESGLRLEASLLLVAPQTVQVRALFLDQSGRPVVHLVRSLDLEKGIAYHNSLVIHAPQDQNHGLGLRTFVSHLPLYEKAGLRQIDLFANSEVGGYFWARVGFELSHPEAGESIRRSIDSELQVLRELRMKLESLGDPALQKTISDLRLNEEFLISIDQGDGFQMRSLSRYRPRVRLSESIPKELLDPLREFDGDSESPRSGKSILMGSGWAGTFYLDRQEALWEYVQGRSGIR